MMSPKESNREKTGRRLFGNRGRPLFPFLPGFGSFLGIRWRREGRFAVGRDEELTPAGIRCSATASRLNMIERIMLLALSSRNRGRPFGCAA